MDKIIPNNIKILRKKLGLSLQDVAERGGVSKSEVYYVENGWRTPNQDIIALISKGIGLTAGEVFWLDAGDSNFKEYMQYK